MKHSEDGDAGPKESGWLRVAWARLKEHPLAALGPG